MMQPSEAISSRKQRCICLCRPLPSRNSRSTGNSRSTNNLLRVAILSIICCCCCSLLSARIVTVTAFVPHLPAASTTRTTTTSTTTTTIFAGTPRIDEWLVLKSGAIQGTISNHPTLPDGYEITTSSLDPKSTIRDNALVVTSSGSKYKLLKGLAPKEPPKTKMTKMTKKPKTNAKPLPKAKAAPKAKAKPQEQPKATPAKPPPAPAKPAAVQAPTRINYDLNGKVVGSGKDDYLLVGKLIRSSSKRSQIYYAYKADSDGNPSGPKLTVKITNVKQRLARENINYNRVASKGRVAFTLEGSNSCFIKKVGFCPNADISPSTVGIPKGSSALVLESGDQNIRAFLGDSQKNGLTGSAFRRAAVNICRCVEAMHSSGLVWTDLKAENFVLVGGGGNSNGNSKTIEVKGIDLESAVPIRSCPEDYSPEACPPEFAEAEKAGRGFEFECLKTYDSWSLGMIFYELAVGKNYFRGKSEDAILSLLATGAIVDPTDPSSVAGLDAIEDDRLRDLVRSCLSINPKKRPSIGQILLHPYFLTTGLGPLTF